MPKPQTLPIAIVGGGFSGTLLAINLIRLGGRVVLVERSRESLARGLAYGTRNPEHLLNVRASNMSAYPDDLTHFQRWMGFSTAEQANRFVPRLTYGQYLREELLRALAAAPDRLALKEQEAVAVEAHPHHEVLVLASGERIEARAVVLASGHFAPVGRPEFAGLPANVVVTNPWDPSAVAGLPRGANVLLIGTGLTAVDVALSLDKTGFDGKITALSRRGLVSRAHALEGPVVGAVPRPEARGSWLLRRLRQRAAEVGWRHAVDELRPHTQSLWRLHDPVAQARFLRHLRAWWDVHRHRLAPVVAERLEQLRRDGRLEFVAGKLVGAVPSAVGAWVEWRPRGQVATLSAEFARVILCTGPEGDLARSPDPLLGGLLRDGRIRPDVHRLGLEVDHLGRTIDAKGQRQDRLLAVGPITKGGAWEIIAVPDIRRQVWEVARWLTNHHWVAEGL